jgi:hypothetical protein
LVLRREPRPAALGIVGFVLGAILIAAVSGLTQGS